MSDEIKWNKNRHEENLLRQEAEKRKEEVNRKIERLNSIYKNWKKSMRLRIKTLSDVVEQFDVLIASLKHEVGGDPDLKDWMDATTLMLEDAKARASKGMLNVVRSGDNPLPKRRLKKRIRSARRRGRR